MHRYAITIEYDGTPFVGWQRQSRGRSVQGEIEQAIGKLSTSGITLRGAGRTDAGVHATGQVAHFDLERAWEPFRLTEALNFHLKPSPIAVVRCAVVGPAFDARFSAIGRRYVYRILNRRAPAAIDRDRVWRIAAQLDCDAMRDAAQVLVGHHDFTTFRASECQAKSPVKTLDSLMVSRHGDLIEIETTARSFLHSQVRSMVGSLKRVGEGRWSRQDLSAALEARDRQRCGPIAPAAGLYLASVAYPPGLYEPDIEGARLSDPPDPP
jgi:tRNA pseudouridine38-40 synthase